jgi:Flp pilus assembly protein TadB
VRQASVKLSKHTPAAHKEGEAMPIITIIVVLVVIGLVLYLIENYIPMSPPIKTVMRVVVVLGLCLWLLNALGIMRTPIRFN